MSYVTLMPSIRMAYATGTMGTPGSEGSEPTGNEYSDTYIPLKETPSCKQAPSETACKITYAGMYSAGAVAGVGWGGAIYLAFTGADAGAVALLGLTTMVGASLIVATVIVGSIILIAKAVSKTTSSHSQPSESSDNESSHKSDLSWIERHR